jgi:hypothetical protein
LQHPKHVVATSDVQQLRKNDSCKNQDVGDCLRPYSSVIATAAYVCFGKKKKKNN